MMKKLFIMFLCFLCLGCTSNQSDESIQFDEYHEIQERLLKQRVFDDKYNFDVYVVYNKLENQYRYDLIIDNPKDVMYDITAMCYVDENTEDMFPNIGIFNNNLYHLKKDYINKEDGYYKGIQLSGITSEKNDVKLYISYYDENSKKIEMFIEVSDEIR